LTDLAVLSGLMPVFIKTSLGAIFLYNVVPPPATLIYNIRRCPPPKTDLSYSGLEEFKQLKFESYGPKSCETESKNASEDIPNELKEYLDAPLIKDRVSNNKDYSVESPVVVEKKTVVPTIAKVEFIRLKQQEKPLRKPVKYAEMYRSQGPRGNQRNWNNLKSQQLGRSRNMSYLSDFKEFDGGYVTFRGGANGSRITSKGTHKN
nr:hypothetical protein [Tanacetum cinerariifolium]